MTKNEIFFKRWAAEFAGLAIGLQILVKAWDKLPYFSHYPLHVGFLIFAGLFVTFGSIFHHLLEKRIKHVHALFHLIEGVVFIIIALILIEKGKFRMPAFLIFIGCLYVVLGAVNYKMNEENYMQFGKQLLKWLGFAFLAFGLSAIGLNWYYDKDEWVLGIAVLFILFGLFYLIFTDRILSKMKKPL